MSLSQRLRKLAKLGGTMARLGLSAVVNTPALLFAEPVRDLVLVSGADQSHAKSLLQFVRSVRDMEPSARLVVYDLGLTEASRQAVASTYPPAMLRTFEYERYPPWMHIKVATGSYAWKPVILAEVMEDFGLPTCWMDAGNVITKPLVSVRRLLATVGFYCPYSTGRIADWTHPETLRFLGADARLLNRLNLHGACVGVNPAKREARDLICRWRDCALQKDCIAPAGSSRANHRQDQAVLTVLAHQCGLAGRGCLLKLGFMPQQDID